MNSQTAIKNLLAHWRGQRSLRLPHGISLREIELFEDENKVHLPTEFSDYLRLVDGFGIGDAESSPESCDGEGFEFYALAKQKIINPGYLIFCSWPYGLIEYAICCVKNSRKNGVVVRVIDDDGGYLLANNFSDFISLYLKDLVHVYSSEAEIVVFRD